MKQKKYIKRLWGLAAVFVLLVSGFGLVKLKLSLGTKATGEVRGQAGDMWADVIIGQPNFSEGMPRERVANKTFNNGGVLVDRSVKPNRVYVVDNGNSRILAYSSLGKCSNNVAVSCTDSSDCGGKVCNLISGKNADKVIGQTGFQFGSCNGDANFISYPNRSSATNGSLCLMPQGQISPAEGGAFLSIAVDKNHNVYVPDWLNNRILMFKDPFGSGGGAGDSIADEVWGQTDFSGNLCNKIGRDSNPSASSLCFANEDSYDSSSHPTFSVGIDVDQTGNLWVADALNSRVVRFPFDTALGKPAKVADLVLGQPDFVTRSEINQPGLSRFRYPGAVKVNPTTGKVLVLDTYNDDDLDGKLGRVLIFSPPFVSGMSGSRWGILNKPFNLPTGIEFVSTGDKVWINDSGNQLLELWNSDGNQLLNVLFNDRWTTGGWNSTLSCSNSSMPCFLVDSRGSLGITSTGDLLVAGSSNEQDVYLFKAPIATPAPGKPISTDFRFYYPPSGFNKLTGRSFSAPMGVAAVGNQLIVADNLRLMFWNNASNLGNNWPEASGVVGSSNLSYQDSWGYSRIKADLANHLYVIHKYQIEIYNLPLIGGVTSTGTPKDVPVKILPLQLKDLNGKTVDLSKGNTSDYSTGGLHPAPFGEYLWIAQSASNRVVRVRNPLGADPRIDVILGQQNSIDNECNFGAGETNPDPMSLCGPGAVGMDGQMNVYVSDGTIDSRVSGSENSGNRRLLRYNATKLPLNNNAMIYALPYDYRWYFSNMDQRFNTLDPVFNFNNRMIIANNPYSRANSKHSLEYFNDTTVMDWQSPSGLFNDWLAFPYSSDFDEAGNLYVVDMNRGRVLKYFTPFGSPGATELLYPKNEIVAKKRPEFDWQDSPGAMYYNIQIAKDALFKNIISNARVSASAYTIDVDLPVGITVYWRVNIVFNSGISNWSGTSSFSTAAPLPTPILVSPMDAVFINTFSPKLDWGDSVSQTTYFQVLISTMEDFTSTVYNATVSGIDKTTGKLMSYFVPNTPLSKNTTYYWKVRAGNNQFVGDWSARWSFKSPDLKSCSSDCDCTCAKVGTSCDFVNTAYSEGNCSMPDFCSGIDGRGGPVCVGGKCMYENPRNETVCSVSR